MERARGQQTSLGVNTRWLEWEFLLIWLSSDDQILTQSVIVCAGFWHHAPEIQKRGGIFNIQHVFWIGHKKTSHQLSTKQDHLEVYLHGCCSAPCTSCGVMWPDGAPRPPTVREHCSSVDLIPRWVGGWLNVYGCIWPCLLFFLLNSLTHCNWSQEASRHWSGANNPLVWSFLLNRLLSI